MPNNAELVRADGILVFMPHRRLAAPVQIQHTFTSPTSSSGDSSYYLTATSISFLHLGNQARPTWLLVL